MCIITKILISIFIVFITAVIIKIIYRRMSCPHVWTEFTQEITYNKSRRCYKCGKTQIWFGYWKNND